MNISLSTIDWTAISAIVSLLMVIATFVSLMVNNRQLKEMKRQWKEEHRPVIQIYIVVISGYFLVCVRNVGNVMAVNVRLHFNEFFKETLIAKQLRDAFVENEELAYVIPAHDRKYFYMMPTKGFASISYSSTHETISGSDFIKWVDEHIDDELYISCTYTSQDQAEVYSTDYKTSLKHCFGHTALVIDNDTDAILEVNKTLEQINKNLRKRE